MERSSPLYRLSYKVRREQAVGTEDVKVTAINMYKYKERPPVVEIIDSPITKSSDESDSELNTWVFANKRVKRSASSSEESDAALIKSARGNSVVNADSSSDETDADLKASVFWTQIPPRDQKVDMKIFEGLKVENATELPFDIDGLRHFKLKSDPVKMMNSSKDGRPWQTWCTSKRSQHRGVRRRARCGGSWRCPNPKCLFLKEKGSCNDVQFTEGKNKTCFVCEEEATFVTCPAVKIWEFSTDKTEVDIYHFGYHTCRAIPNKRNLQVESKLEEDFQKHASLKPSEAAANTLVCALKKPGSTWEEIESLAESLSDSRRIQNTKAKAKKSPEQNGHSFDALCEFKKFCDEKDPFYVYRVNDERQDGSLTYVFKCSRFQADMALSMDRNGNGLLYEQYCYADAPHKRCPGFKTLTLWVFHPLLRKLVKLATMESSREDTEAFVQFWSLLNEVLQALSGNKEYVFNPTGWVLDEAGAQWNAIKIIFGEAAVSRVVSCEFHYKQSVNRKSVKLNGASRTHFEQLAGALLEANTVSVFEKKRADLNRFIKEKPEERKFLSSWVQWWENRKTHIFRAFKNSVNAPRMNMAETGHSTWVKSGAIQLTLVDAARHDVGENVRLQKTVKRFLEGPLKSTGKGPSTKEVHKRLRLGQLRRARAYGSEILSEDFEGDPYSPVDAAGFVDPESSHNPTKRGKKRKNVKSSKGQFSKQLTKCLEATKREASEMHLDGMVEITTDHRKFIVKHGQTQYDVDICHTPSCSCPDLRSRHCKHVLWVLLYVLNVHDDAPLLQEKRLPKDTLQTLLSENSNATGPPPNSSPSATHLPYQAPMSAPIVPRSSVQVSTPVPSQALPSTSVQLPSQKPRRPLPPTLIQSGNISPLGSMQLPVQSLPSPQPSTAASSQLLGNPSSQPLMLTSSQSIFTTCSQSWPQTVSQSSQITSFSPLLHTLPRSLFSTQPSSVMQQPPLAQTVPDPVSLPRPCANPGSCILTLLRFCHASVSVCYGCQQPLKVNGQIPPPPFDLLIMTQMRREYCNNGQKMSRMGNAYFHANMHCMSQRLPFFHPSMVQLQPGLFPQLLQVHREALPRNLGLQL